MVKVRWITRHFAKTADEMLHFIKKVAAQCDSVNNVELVKGLRRIW